MSSVRSSTGSQRNLARRADRLTPRQRSENMRAVRGKDTVPELVVRRLMHRLGYRFRLHSAKLPGKPDLTLPKHKTVIFVHGCFWHGHQGCARSIPPKSNAAFWEAKLARNRERDADQVAALGETGWRVLIVWECETKNLQLLATRISDFLAVGPSA